jgi:hypothetical protein
MTRLRLTCALVLFSVAAYGQRQMTVAQLVDFIKSAIQQKNDDRTVAKFVGTIKLTNRLDDATVEQLQNLGAGPRTVSALRALTDTTASLPPPPPPAAAAKAPAVVVSAPLKDEFDRILSEVRENALNYTKSLPNFLCTQVTRRFVDASGKESWIPQDTIQEHLAYVDGHEDYKVVAVKDSRGQNMPVVNESHRKLGGVTSSGEFGSMLAEIFDPATEADFQWNRWAKVGGRVMYVLDFRVEQSRSRYSILDENSGREIISGYHGQIYADTETGRVMKIAMDCDTIPADFPIQQVRLTMDYGFENISGKQFVLPERVELRSKEGRILNKNNIEFRLYRKFTTESSITFDTPDPTPDPLPEDKFTPEPAAPAPPPHN